MLSNGGEGAVRPSKLSQNSTCCVTTRQARYVVTWRAVSCVMCRAWSNMADDEEAVVLAFKTISCFIIFMSHSWLRTCRACCTACAKQHVRLFPIPKCMGYSESWRVVTWRNKWNLGFRISDCAGDYLKRLISDSPAFRTGSKKVMRVA